MNEGEQALLQRILRSHYFSRAPNLLDILSYLCEHTTGSGSDRAIKEYEIATNVLRRPESFDSKHDPIVRVNVSTIRERLEQYFRNEGRREELRLVIPRGIYRAVFHEAGTLYSIEPEGDSEWPALKEFWNPHIAEFSPNVLLFSRLLFLRDREGNFIRNIFVNDIGSAKTEMGRRLKGVDLSRFIPSYHFLSAGEMHCMYELSRMFGQMGIRVSSRSLESNGIDDLEGCNLILVGSPRTNSLLRSFQEGGNFLLSDSEITNARPQAGEAPTYTGYRHSDGKLVKRREYAVVTRRPGTGIGASVTAVAANHGRAIEGVGRFLTTETRVSEILNALKPNGDRLPRSFQVLFSVDMVDFDEEVIGADYQAHRILD